MHLHGYRRKVYYTVGQSTVISGCFIVKAFTHKGLYMKICSKQYDLQQHLKKHVDVVQVEVL